MHVEIERRAEALDESDGAGPGAGSMVAVQARAQDDPVRRAAESPVLLDLTVDEAFGRQLLFDYGILEGGVPLRMHVTVQPHEIFWSELREGCLSETEAAQTIQLDEHRAMVSWTEESGAYIVMYADVSKGETSFCGLYPVGDTKQSLCYTGTIENP